MTLFKTNLVETGEFEEEELHTRTFMSRQQNQFKNLEEMTINLVKQAFLGDGGGGGGGGGEGRRGD